jgi:tRNA threonylcarbamoyladenosine biosynthesis protein TsaB
VKILAVETATAWQSVALLDGPHVVARSDQDAAGSHAKRLVPAIDRLFRGVGWTLDSLDGLAVSIGPGSFTGLRVGLATMLGFRSVTGLPLAAVPTLEGMAWNLRGADRPLCPVLKSRAGEVYWARYRWMGSGALERVAEERVGPLGELARSIEGPTFVFGDGWQAYREEFQRLLGTEASDVREPPLDVMVASAVSVGLAGMDLLAQGLVAGPGLSPRYIQRAEAEVVWERRAAASAGTSLG